MKLIDTHIRKWGRDKIAIQKAVYANLLVRMALEDPQMRMEYASWAAPRLDLRFLNGLSVKLTPEFNLEMQIDGCKHVSEMMTKNIDTWFTQPMKERPEHVNAAHHEQYLIFNMVNAIAVKPIQMCMDLKTQLFASEEMQIIMPVGVLADALTQEQVDWIDDHSWLWTNGEFGLDMGHRNIRSRYQIVKSSLRKLQRYSVMFGRSPFSQIPYGDHDTPVFQYSVSPMNPPTAVSMRKEIAQSLSEGWQPSDEMIDTWWS